MNPEIMKMVQEKMKTMTPEQLRQMQEMEKKMTPEMKKMAMDKVKNMSAADAAQMKEKLKSTSAEDMCNGQQFEQLKQQMDYSFRASETLKADGNKLVADKKWTLAIEKYNRALTNQKEDPSVRSVELKKSCQLNLALCYLNSNQNKKVVEICSQLMMDHGEQVKALYRRGMAYKALGELEFSLTDLQRANVLAPTDDTNTKALGEVKAALEERNKELAAAAAAEPAAANDEMSPIREGLDDDEIAPPPLSPAAVKELEQLRETEAAKKEAERKSLEAAAEKRTVEEEARKEEKVRKDRMDAEQAKEAKRVADEKAAVKQAAQEAKRKYEKEAAAARLAALKPQGGDNATEIIEVAHSMMHGDTSIVDRTDNHNHAAKEAEAMRKESERREAEEASDRANAEAERKARALEAAERARVQEADAKKDRQRLAALKLQESERKMKEAADKLKAEQKAAEEAKALSSQFNPNEEMSRAFQMLNQDPTMMKTISKQMENMTDEQFEMMNRQALARGMPSMDKDMYKQMAKQMENMPPDELKKMMEMSASMQGGVPGASLSAASESPYQASLASTGAASSAASSVADAKGSAMGGMGDLAAMASNPQVAAQMEAMTKDPAMMDMMNNMMKNMTGPQLKTMYKTMGKEMSDEEAEKAAAMFQKMKPEDMQKMMKVAGGLQKVWGYITQLRAFLSTRSGMAIAFLLIVLVLQHFQIL